MSLRRIEIEAQQAEARAVGEQQANIARAEGVRQSNVLQAQGEAQAITTIDEQLRQSPSLPRVAQIPEMGWTVAISCGRRRRRNTFYKYSFCREW